MSRQRKPSRQASVDEQIQVVLAVSPTWVPVVIVRASVRKGIPDG